MNVDVMQEVITLDAVVEAEENNTDFTPLLSELNPQELSIVSIYLDLLVLASELPENAHVNFITFFKSNWEQYYTASEKTE